MWLASLFLVQRDLTQFRSFRSCLHFSPLKVSSFLCFTFTLLPVPQLLSASATNISLFLCLPDCLVCITITLADSCTERGKEIEKSECSIYIRIPLSLFRWIGESTTTTTLLPRCCTEFSHLAVVSIFQKHSHQHRQILSLSECLQQFCSVVIIGFSRASTLHPKFYHHSPPLSRSTNTGNCCQSQQKLKVNYFLFPILPFPSLAVQLKFINLLNQHFCCCCCCCC